MKMEVLKSMRFFAAVILGMLVVLSVKLNPGQLTAPIVLEPLKSWPGILAVMGAAIYEIFKLRKRVFGNPFVNTDTHIVTRLIRIAGLDVTPDDIEKDRAIRSYWRLINEDKTLDKKSALVMWEGYLVSTSKDAVLYAIVGVFVNFAQFVRTIFVDQDRLIIAFVWVVIGLLSYFVLLPKAIKNHRKAVDAQLDFIADHHSKDISAAIKLVSNR